MRERIAFFPFKHFVSLFLCPFAIKEAFLTHQNVCIAELESMSILSKLFHLDLDGSDFDIIQPRDAQLIRQLIAETRPTKPIGARMKSISARLLGRPYLARPLVGSLTQPEVLVTRMDGFDCVTLVETVLAVAISKNLDEFLSELRNLRYLGGEVDYRNRLHYATDWSRHQIERGLLLDMTLGEETVPREKMLYYVKSLKPKLAVFRYFPKHNIDAVSRWLLDGDIIFFVSGRDGLDTSHMGMVFRDNQRLMMRHATRSHHYVVEQDLMEFFRLMKMSGFIINRPKDI